MLGLYLYLNVVVLAAVFLHFLASARTGVTFTGKGEIDRSQFSAAIMVIEHQSAH
jgi:hypothetical protein